MFLQSLAKPPVTEASDALIQQVDTCEVQPYAGLLDLVITGSVVPHREIKIAAEVGGTVAKKYPACEAGNFVSKGEKLLEINAEEYQIEIRKLEAEVLQSEKRIEENLQQIAGEELNIELAETGFCSCKNRNSIAIDGLVACYRRPNWTSPNAQ